MENKDLKQVVKEKYGEIAKQSKEQAESSCCGSIGCCSTLDYKVFSENYQDQEGYSPDADLGLGCGIPTQFAGIRKGDSVLDLGSGAGNDCFVARAIVGDSGQVTGLDFTDGMLVKASDNNKKLGYSNVEFVKGDIEEMPLPDNQYDVVISNCVLNLVPDKKKAFGEIYRVLKPGGHFCVSDVVIKGVLSEKMKKDAELYAGCVSGACEMNEYLKIVENTGFVNVQVHKQKEIKLPETLLSGYNDPKQLKAYYTGDTGIFSITVSADKPSGFSCVGIC